MSGRIAEGRALVEEAARVSYEEGLKLADDLGMRPVAAHRHLGLGRLFARVGRDAEASAERAAAADLYRAMGMTRWLSLTGSS
jgi:hypothetical protein